MKLGYTPTLEPLLDGKHPDCLIETNNVKMFFEVITPEQSQNNANSEKILYELSQSVLNEYSNLSIEISLLSEIDPDLAKSILEFIRKIPISSQIQELKGVAEIVKEFQESNLEGKSRIKSDLHASYQILSGSQIGGINMPSRVIIKTPLEDTRVQKLISKELHHFSKNTINIIVINVTDIIGGMHHWSKLINRCFQPTRNTRLGGVILYRESLCAEPLMMKLEGKNLKNPYALKPPTESFLNAIDQLFQENNKLN